MSKGHFSADSPQKSVSPRRIITVAVICVLVSALAGREHVLDAYKLAVQEKYRFFSFGDAMLIK